MTSHDTVFATVCHHTLPRLATINTCHGLPRLGLPWLTLLRLPRLATTRHGLPRLATACHGLLAPVFCHVSPRPATARHGLLRFFPTPRHGLPRLVAACHGLPWVSMTGSMAYHGFLTRLRLAMAMACQGLLPRFVGMTTTCRGLPRLAMACRQARHGPP